MKRYIKSDSTISDTDMFSGDSEVRRRYADRTNDPNILLIYAYDPDRHVRDFAASNPNTPLEAILDLAEDPDWRVRDGVAMNANTPAEILEKLSSESNWSIREHVASNPSTPTDVLLKLVDDPVSMVSNAAKLEISSRKYRNK